MSAQFIAGKEVQGKEKCIVAVDLGYSRKKKSCGFCVTGGEGTDLPFGKMVEEVKKALNDDKDPLLVIEAPLSTYHIGNGDSREGNPERRFKAEEGNHEWYCHAGANVLLGARRLLEQLSLNLNQREIRIAEAFYTGNKDHAEVAQLIANKFGKSKSPPVGIKEPRDRICELIDQAPNIYDFGNL